MTSIIIPAHNEEANIAGNLQRLLAGLEHDSTEIIVVCNGCTDDTVSIARSFGGSVRVLEITMASKIAALNAGDAVAQSYPRIYLDADIGLDGASASMLARSLREHGVFAAETSVRFDFRRSTRLVQIYYIGDVALHGQSPGDLGRGVYALSEDGRNRFDEFPDVIADDAYARAHFGPGELVAVPDAVTTVRVPSDLASLIRIKTRSRMGTRQLQVEYPDLWKRKRANTTPWIRKLPAIYPLLWPTVGVFLVVQLATRWRARQQLRHLESYEWERDDSSRTL
jgi:cellulose synthase/poly-beta-1,6-N-acetylglucosamine synthase-like glycosyltransferase